MDKKIDIILVSGFLGSGKTTLLNRMLKFYSKKKLGLLVNDFGKLPVDGALLKASNRELFSDDNKIYEIGNGSIFCTCLVSEFISGLDYFSENRPDILFIETSGMSDFSSLGTILNSNNYNDSFNVLYSITVVETEKFPILVKTLQVVSKQVAGADYILINKCDLIGREELKKIELLVKGLNANAEIFTTEYGKIDLNLLNKTSGKSSSFALEECSSPESRQGSIFLSQSDISMEKMESFLTKIVTQVYRIKGFYSFNGETFYISNNNSQIRIENTPYKDDGEYGLSILCSRNSEESISREWSALIKPAKILKVTV